MVFHDAKSYRHSTRRASSNSEDQPTTGGPILDLYDLPLDLYVASAVKRPDAVLFQPSDRVGCSLNLIPTRTLSGLSMSRHWPGTTMAMIFSR